MQTQTTVLFLMAPPADWAGPPQVLNGLGGYPATKKIEQAGKFYEELSIRRASGIAFDSSEESAGAKVEVETPKKVSRRKVLAKEAANAQKHSLLIAGAIDDPYTILDLEKERWQADEDSIRNAYRRMVVKYHPDKNPGVSDEAFKKIQEAFDTLTDIKKRRAFDSTDDNEVVQAPSVFREEKEDFFVVFGTLFKKTEKWSLITKNIPSIGDMDTPLEQVDKFYDWWYSFKSWKDFSFLDEHKIKDADSRDERRWMEKENEKLRKKHKKDEAKRVFKITEMAEKCDPRYKKARDAKKAEKDEKLRIELEKKEREEREAKEAQEKKEAAEKEAAQSAEDSKKAKMAENKRCSKLRNKIRGLITKNTKLNPTVDEQELVLSKLTGAQLDKLMVSLNESEDSGKAAFDEFYALLKK
jgi:DnaJ family protein C protein 2